MCVAVFHEVNVVPILQMDPLGVFEVHIIDV